MEVCGIGFLGTFVHEGFGDQTSLWVEASKTYEGAWCNMEEARQLTRWLVEHVDTFLFLYCSMVLMEVILLKS